MNKTLPYRLNSQLDKKILSDRLCALLKTWQEEWLQKPVEISLELSNQESPGRHIEGKWLFAGEAPDLWIAWKFDNEVIKELLALMFNVPLESIVSISPLTQEISKECLSSLCNSIFASFGMKENAKPEWTESLDALRIGEGSGALIAEIKGFASRQYVAIGGDVVKKMIGNRAYNSANSYALIGREFVLGKYKTLLEVTVGTALLTLEELTNLEVGDVIKINALIKQPLKVKTLEGVPVAGALLGIKGHNKAIQLTEL